MSLGDCILHRDQHEMSQECWRAVLAWRLARAEGEASPDRYKAAYERAVLDQVTKEPR